MSLEKEIQQIIQLGTAQYQPSDELIAYFRANGLSVESPVDVAKYALTLYTLDERLTLSMRKSTELPPISHAPPEQKPYCNTSYDLLFDEINTPLYRLALFEYLINMVHQQVIVFPHRIFDLLSFMKEEHWIKGLWGMLTGQRGVWAIQHMPSFKKQYLAQHYDGVLPMQAFSRKGQFLPDAKFHQILAFPADKDVIRQLWLALAIPGPTISPEIAPELWERLLAMIQSSEITADEWSQLEGVLQVVLHLTPIDLVPTFDPRTVPELWQETWANLQLSYRFRQRMQELAGA